MTKFDHKNNLPAIFKNNRLSILPIKRGSYIIGHSDTYHTLETNAPRPKCYEFPYDIESIDFNHITSEATAIQCAYLTGILEDFIGENIRQTISGRMGSKDFSFWIEEHTSKNNALEIKVSNAQIEIDAGFENYDSIILMEAKNNISDDFHIRQLYYPFRLFYDKKEKKQLTKNIRSIFMTYSNNIFNLYEYEFIDPRYYNSLHLIKHQEYLLAEDQEIRLEELINLRASVDPTLIERTATLNIQFPQADDFKRIINICENLQETPMSSFAVAKEYNLVPRQGNYYIAAGQYLGLINNRRKNEYSLTLLAEKILKLPYKKRQLAFAKLILADKIFGEIFDRTIENGGNVISKEEIIAILNSHHHARPMADKTIKRRASTASRWIIWIIDLTISS